MGFLRKHKQKHRHMFAFNPLPVFANTERTITIATLNNGIRPIRRVWAVYSATPIKYRKHRHPIPFNPELQFTRAELADQLVC